MTPDQTFAALHQAAQSRTGARLFTVTVVDAAAGLVRRPYSSHPLDYPVSGTKPLGHDAFTRQVLVEGRPFIADTTAEFAHLFPDHAQINALGCHAAMKIPVSDGGVVLGTINILDVAGHFTPDRIAALTALVAERLPTLATAMRATPMAAEPDRLARLRHRMAATGTDLVALAPGAHLRWLAGFSPHGDERPCLMLVTPDAAGFLMPALNATDARQHTDLPFWEWSDDHGPRSAPTTALAALGPHPARLALDEAMRADHAMLLLDALPDGARGFAADTIGHLRMRKDAAEIALLRGNARIADLAQTALHHAISPGIPEAALADIAAATFRAHGAAPEFTLVGTGAHSAFPHHATGDAAVRSGDALVVDIGGRKGGYHSDITRMALCGTAPDGYTGVHAVVEAAAQAALATIRPGVRARDVDAAARGTITAAGDGDHFTHRTGHGLGLELHEPPYITATCDLVLEPGMVFTVEPGIYLPGRFGVRLEEVAVETDTGVEVLSGLGRVVWQG